MPNTENEILKWGSNTYVKRMMENFKNNFGFYPSKEHSTMTPDYKPGLHTTELFTDNKKAQYWKCIGEMQWSIALDQIYIMYAMVVVLRYPPDPCKGHLSNIQHLYGYLNKYTSTYIKFNI